ncbi:MAG: heme o synthase [Acidobacteria bacterium]|nr:heme o synthase [Acidobacteriota bacterium]
MTTEAAAIARPRSRLGDFFALTKPRLNSLVVVTAGVGYLAGRSGPLDPVSFFHATVGAALVAGGAAALNQVSERDLDARMRRTEDRPLPRGRLRPIEAIWAALALALAGLVQLALGANLTAALVALATLLSYVAVYTPLKRVTHWALLVGAVPGALPVVIGWAAVAPLSPGAWTLFALVFVWQLPHFLALTWLFREDFARANLPLLSLTDRSGRRTATHLLAYATLLIPVSVAPTWYGIAGTTYAVGAAVMSVALLALGVWFARERNTDRARLVFRATLAYLPIVWLLLLVDRVG